MIVVHEKAKKLSSKSRSDYEKYLLKNPVPVVIGNGGQFYMIDKHHLARAVYEIGKNEVAVHIVKNLNTLEGADFWSEMSQQGLFYDRDENDQVEPFTALPHFIQDLTDDPYRSLSGHVRDQGGYAVVTSVYYLEFLWAHFFHQLDPSAHLTPNDLAADFNGSVSRALEIAHSDEASTLPGFSSTPVSTSNKSASQALSQ